MADGHEPELIERAAAEATRLIAGLKRDAAELAAASGVAEKAAGETALAGALAAARRVLDELSSPQAEGGR
jgi:hypothetical protein